ncbi:MAG: hypothetical protein A2V70_12385 [Planctomycetes bacterium RBG_13_63_9]|nr:MAG: hypothetical protein A2V70_12385 [Planctomycetes bacterium RBG_13_63_9]
MFVWRGLMWCLSLPLLWLGRLAAMWNMPVSVPLLKGAWHLSGDANVAVVALSAIERHASREAAQAQAAAWLATRPSSQLVAYAGLLAVQAEQWEQAQILLARGLELGPDPAGLLELLEVSIPSSDGRDAATTELARRFELRKDLSPPVSKIIHTTLLWNAVFSGRFEEAQRRANWLWSIEDDPSAATTFWVLAKRRGSEDSLDEYLGRIRLTAPQRLFFEAMGLVAVNATDEAREVLAALSEFKPSLANIVRTTLEQKESAE